MGGSSGVGGDTGTVHDGGQGLTTLATSVGTRSQGVTQATGAAGGAAGDATAAAALTRFGAAGSGMAHDLSTAFKAAGQLATNASIDLAHAGGEG